MDRRRFLGASAAAAIGGFVVSEVPGERGRKKIGEGRPSEHPYQYLSKHDTRVRELLSRMTLAEKAGQMVQVEQVALKDPRDVETYFLGSLLSGGGSDPRTGNGVNDWSDLYDGYQSRALKTRLRIPILFGIDAVHGHNNVVGAVIFPHNIGLGCTRNASLIERAARVTATEVRATGIQWTFAPCVTVPRDERWGRTYEGFGESPDLARTLGEAAVRGLQGSDLADPLSVLACAKHFVGDGGTEYGTGLPDERRPQERLLDHGDTRLGERELREIHMQGYVGAIRAGVGTIMPSYSSWNGIKCSASRRLLTQILKGELGFEGFLISDYNAIDELPGDYKSQIEQSVNAGMDMFMVTERYPQLYALLIELVREKRVPISRIDDAVGRILRIKFALGLMDEERTRFADRSLHRLVGSAEHRRVARECVRQSVVLLKNDGRVLPVSKGLARIHVAGKSADDIGNQCGGWTIDWQGKSGPVTTGGTTVLEAIRKTVSRDTKVTFSRDGSGAGGAGAGIVVIGETPYAEMKGDRKDLRLDSEDLAAVAAVKRAGIPTIVILISGRPLLLDRVIRNCDAFLAAWLPGTEGQGIADVLFGDHKPSGRLSFSWPRTMDQVPINVGDPGDRPLFEYGYGLTT